MVSAPSEQTELPEVLNDIVTYPHVNLFKYIVNSKFRVSYTVLKQAKVIQSSMV